MGKLTQKQIVLNHLRLKGSISTLECYNEYRITDLQHYIYELRKDGMNITDRWVKSTNKFGWENHYKVYTLKEEV